MVRPGIVWLGVVDSGMAGTDCELRLGGVRTVLARQVRTGGSRRGTARLGETGNKRSGAAVPA